MRRSCFDPGRQRTDRSFEWQGGARTGRDIFVSSCETYWRNGWVLRGDLVQLNRIFRRSRPNYGYSGVYAPVTETQPHQLNRILEIKSELRLFRG